MLLVQGGVVQSRRIRTLFCWKSCPTNVEPDLPTAIIRTPIGRAASASADPPFARARSFMLGSAAAARAAMLIQNAIFRVFIVVYNSMR